MDSMALYQRMDIGTAKPTAEEREAVPHHLVDVIEPWEEYSLAQYIAAAEKCAAEITGRGNQVLFVGGTPLYLKGLLRGIFEGPAADEEFRRNLREEAKRREPAWLHEEVKKVDPAAAARLHPNDEKRLIRALEVFHFTGRPISEWQQQFEIDRPAEVCKVFVLDWPRAELHARIEQRVEAMFARGLVEEVRGLIEDQHVSSFPRSGVGTQFPDAPESKESPTDAEFSTCPLDAGASQNCVPTPERGNEGKDQGIEQLGPHPRPLSRPTFGWCPERGESQILSKTARQAVGYQEVIEYLEGRHSLDETIELVKVHTRQLAKRQSTWFRSLSECRFVPVTGEVDAGEIVERISR
jgi:tRNA dimethylallyltransferase